LLAAHKTERGPGQLPAEGVVLIGVDVELQRRMAEGIGLPAFGPEKLISPGAPYNSAANIGAPEFDHGSVQSEIDAASYFHAPDNEAPNCSAPAINRASASTFPAEQIEGIHMIAEAADIERAPGIDAPDSGAPKFDALCFGAPEFDAPEFVRDLLIRRAGTKSYTVHPILRIKDILTSAERDLLRWLWEKGRAVPVTARMRLVTGPNGEGARRLATQAGLIYNTFKNLTRALSTKFALDIVKPERNLPAIYAVYDDASILERQRQAGFTGVVRKNGGGRELVNAEARPAPRRRDLRVKELEQILGAQNLAHQRLRPL
jgi:hypothetical protein